MTNYYGALTIHGHLEIDGTTLIRRGTDEALDQFMVKWPMIDGRFDGDNPKITRTVAQLAYKRTALGWYNVNHVSDGATYNVRPDVFHAVTGVSDYAHAGCTAVTADQLAFMLADSFTRCIGRTAGSVAV